MKLRRGQLSVDFILCIISVGLILSLYFFFIDSASVAAGSLNYLEKMRLASEVGDAIISGGELHAKELSIKYGLKVGEKTIYPLENPVFCVLRVADVGGEASLVEICLE